jgi:hypothetical protein
VSHQWQEFDTIVVEAHPDGGQLAFARIPAPPDADEVAADEATAAAACSTGGGGRQQRQQQQQQQDGKQQSQQQPIPVEIPNVMRHVDSFGRMSAGSTGGGGGSSGGASSSKPPLGSGAPSGSGSSKVPAGLGGGSGRSMKYDPLAPVAKRPGAGKQQQQQPAAPAAVNGSSSSRLNGAAAPAGEGPALGSSRNSSIDSLPALMQGLDESVAARLDPNHLPAFLKTPQRRDGHDDSLPTQSY